jgi:hypothetical protein
MLQVQKTSAMMCSEFSRHRLSFGTRGGAVPRVDSTRTQYRRRDIDLASRGTRNTRRPPCMAECLRGFGCARGGHPGATIVRSSNDMPAIPPPACAGRSTPAHGGGAWRWGDGLAARDVPPDDRSAVKRAATGFIGATIRYGEFLVSNAMPMNRVMGSNEGLSVGRKAADR